MMLYRFFLLVVLLLPTTTYCAHDQELSLRRRRQQQTRQNNYYENNGLQCSSCQSDNDCQGVLLCYPAEHPFVIAAGCGTQVARQQQQQLDDPTFSTTSYCIPQAIVENNSNTNTNNDNNSNNNPQSSSGGGGSSSLQIISPKLAQFIPPYTRLLQHCEAQCFFDNDCAPGLTCYRRKSGDPAPGCYFDSYQPRGIDIARSVDICIDKIYTDAPTSEPTQSPTTFQPTQSPTQLVQEEVAVSTPQPTFEPTTKAVTTTQSPTTPTAALATFVGNPPPRPLQRCEAECDMDSECEGDLICFSRENGQPAPGCRFDPASAGRFGISLYGNHDVCIERGTTMTRLRLYWQEGYFWQERTYEQFFCLQTYGNELVTQRCSTSSQQLFEFQHLSDSGGEALIKAIAASGGGDDGTGTDMCVSNRFLQPCNVSEPAQRWNPNQVQSWHGSYFELSNAQDGQQSCLSPHHHPRRNETVYMLNCQQERYFTSNAWQLWW